MRSRLSLTLMGVLAWGAFSFGPAMGQGVEMPVRGVGRELPPAYFDQVRQQPDLFEIGSGWISRVRASAEMSAAVTGSLPVVVVQALMADSPEPHVTSQEIQQALFDGPSAYGTLTEYYEEVSGGRLTVTGQALPWVRTSITLEEAVGDSYGLGGGTRRGDYLLEAVELADPLVDFGQFDNDGLDGIPNSGDDDGEVDAVAFQFLEVAASCGGPGIWPHRSQLRYLNGGDPYPTDDHRPDGSSIVLNDYIIQSAVDCGGDEAQKATTIAHELGHVLGLPDLYDHSQGLEPQYRRWVVGCWSLMAAGSWGCGVENREGWVRPTHLGPWEKAFLGWLDHLEEVGSVVGEEFTLAPVRSSQHVLKVPLESGAAGGQEEYLLLEYRTREGFDQDIPASGVLVYHIDPKIGGNRPCSTCPRLYRVGVLEADGNNSLRMSFLEGGNRGEPGDAWGVAGAGRITSSTNPSTRLNSDAASGVTIYDISLSGGVAHITLSSRTVPEATLLQGFLSTLVAPLTSQERAYLDSHGNQNGQYDVGDLRAYLKR
jgi:immune inhibitor A